MALANAKYPPFTNDEVFKEILEQAENFKKHRAYQFNDGSSYGMAAEDDSSSYN